MTNDELIIIWCKMNGSDPLELDQDDKQTIIAIIKSNPEWEEWFV